MEDFFYKGSINIMIISITSKLCANKISRPSEDIKYANTQKVEEEKDPT
jgi:hypothetical protein